MQYISKNVAAHDLSQTCGEPIRLHSGQALSNPSAATFSDLFFILPVWFLYPLIFSCY
jgi:hypothetical protein